MPCILMKNLNSCKMKFHKVIQCVIKISFSLDFDIGQSYVTSKIEDRDGNIRKINIQPGTRGIKLQSDLIRVKNKDAELPSHVYVRTTLKDGKTLVRKLPVIGTSDWLLIFEEDLFVLAVKGSIRRNRNFRVIHKVIHRKDWHSYDL